MAKKLTIQYRQLKTDNLWEDIDLKAMIVEVLRRRGWAETAKSRILNLDQDGSLVILNKISPPETWDGPIFAGQIIHLQDGTEVQAVLQSLEDDSPEFVLQNIDLGARAKVLRGALYFAAVGNHVGLIEGQQVKGRTLERYLTALLQKADEIDPEQFVILNSKFLTGDGKELSESSEITVSAAPSHGPAAEGLQRIVEREAGHATEHEQATVFDILRILGWSNEALVSLGEEIPEGGWVEGSFKVFIKERQRKKRPISRATINEALRNIDPADLGLKGDGSERGGIVKLSVQREVDTVGGGSLIDPQSAMEQIVNALREWATRGKIDCQFE
ncbi:hypothetical protein [Sphingomonas sanxanigenens]|uniref:hypothetical protein n=1 Tax=Sphingomonas sanxanigenens TaxID=397260 RepID=UPI0013013204|nr:hypothetical protein [Sphingomonas sanxanigenens]